MPFWCPRWGPFAFVVVCEPLMFLCPCVHDINLEVSILPGDVSQETPIRRPCMSRHPCRKPKPKTENYSSKDTIPFSVHPKSSLATPAAVKQATHTPDQTNRHPYFDQDASTAFGHRCLSPV